MKIHFVLGVSIVVNCLPANAQQPTADQKQATVAYLHSLQKENGGYSADSRPETPASIPATSSCLRAIKYFGGEPKRREDCKKFVMSCFDHTSGGFAATPGGKPEIRTTVIGIMAAMELQLRPREYDEASFLKTMKYLSHNAKSFEDIRITAAALEAAQFTLANVDDWMRQIEAMRNPEGVYGSKGNVARDTGSSIAALLRLHGAAAGKLKVKPLKIPNRPAVIQAMRDGQLPDGGFGKEGQTGSDLESTYRVMRAFYMLKERPNLDAGRAFIAKCRNADGSYSPQPGQPGGAGSTYHAAIILHWLDELEKRETR